MDYNEKEMMLLQFNRIVNIAKTAKRPRWTLKQHLYDSLLQIRIIAEETSKFITQNC